MNLMEPIFLSLFANIIRMYAIYRCMEHFFLSKDENKISKICMYTGFVLVNSVGYYLFNNMFINISTNIIGLLPIMSSPKVLILRAFSLNITSQNRAKGVRQSSYPVLNSHKRV